MADRDFFDDYIAYKMCCEEVNQTSQNPISCLARVCSEPQRQNTEKAPRDYSGSLFHIVRRIRVNYSAIE